MDFNWSLSRPQLYNLNFNGPQNSMRPLKFITELQNIQNEGFFMLQINLQRLKTDLCLLEMGPKVPNSIRLLIIKNLLLLHLKSHFKVDIPISNKKIDLK